MICFCYATSIINLKNKTQTIFSEIAYASDKYRNFSQAAIEKEIESENNLRNKFWVMPLEMAPG